MNLAALIEKKIPGEFLSKLRFISGASLRFNLKPYLVGGVVRDLMLDRPFNQDCDVTFSGGNVLPLVNQLAKKWKARLLIYPQFLTCTLEFKNHASIDLITTRKEKYPESAALPVVQPGTIKEDLARRDFSVNAMAVSLQKNKWGELEDPFSGFADLEAKKIRILHPRSFKDDPTRIFRAARFSNRLAFDLDQKTAQFLREAVKAKQISKLSKDRIRAEIEKILEEKDPAGSLRLLSHWKVLPELDAQIQWNLETADEFNEKIAMPARRFAYYLMENPAEDLELFLSRFNFPKLFQNQFLQIIHIYGFLKSGTPADKTPDFRLDPETKNFFTSLCASVPYQGIQKKWAIFSRWQETVPSITGNDLKKMGFLPGPIFKKILGAVRSEKFKGKAGTKQEEIRFVIDNFRRA